MSVEVLEGDAADVLRGLDADSFSCCVTSPPYWGLRDYGVAGQVGRERTPEAWVRRLVGVFRQVRRVLRPDGTFWLNVGDCYADGGRGADVGSTLLGTRRNQAESRRGSGRRAHGVKIKDLVGLPWMLAFALRRDGWWLRSDVVWHKPNPMPESVQDRPTRAHEYVFLLTRSRRYWYDAEALRTPLRRSSLDRLAQDVDSQAGSARANGGTRPERPMGALGKHGRRHAGFNERWDSMSRAEQAANGANARSVWSIATSRWAGAHFATFPVELARRCIVAGCPVGGRVLDPFGGSGTTGVAASRSGRDAVLVEINPAYAAMARQRLVDDEPGLGL